MVLNRNHKTCVNISSKFNHFSERYAGYESFSFYVVNSHILKNIFLPNCCQKMTNY